MTSCSPKTTRPLVEPADIIKVDVLNIERAEIARQYHELRPFGIPLLAEKLSTPEEYADFHALGFDLFQGHYLELPIISKTRRLPHDRTRLLQILAKLYDPDASVRTLETLVASEVGLAVRLLKLAGSATMSRGVAVGTVGQAIARLGVQQVAALVTLILVAGFDDKPLELAAMCSCARGCARRSRGMPASRVRAVHRGLLSLIDGIRD